LAATDTPPKIIVLNFCNSAGTRKSFFPSDRIVVAMQSSVTDVAATAFARRFYAAVAAGQSVKAAFEQGRVAVEAVSLTGANTPELLHDSGTNPAKIVLT